METEKIGSGYVLVVRKGFVERQKVQTVETTHHKRNFREIQGRIDNFCSARP